MLAMVKFVIPKSVLCLRANVWHRWYRVPNHLTVIRGD